MPTESFGKTEFEKKAEENNACRQIVREILNFGVNQRQMMFLIYLLGLELENIEQMREVTAFVKELVPEAFVTGDVENSTLC